MVTGAPGPEVTIRMSATYFSSSSAVTRFIRESLGGSQPDLLSSILNTSSGSDTVHGLVGVQLPKGREARAI